jgi:NhaP-type Na+/H+ or K+/H+ antiporter
MTLKQYAYFNLSQQSQQTTQHMFEVMAQLSENFVFIYLGLTLFTQPNEVFYWGLIFYLFAATLIGRAACIFPPAGLINLIGEIRQQGWRSYAVLTIPRLSSILGPAGIPYAGQPAMIREHQYMLWVHY